MVKQNFDNFLKLMSIALGGLFILGVIIAKFVYPGFSMNYFILILIFSVSIILFGIFNKEILKYFTSSSKNKIELPEPISDKECFKIVEEIIQGPKYANYISEITTDGSGTYGEKIMSQVYTFIGKGYYRDNGKEIKYVIIINKHFPDKNIKVLINPDTNKIREEINRTAVHPSEQPNIKTTVVENMLTGNKMETKEEIYNKQNELKKEQESEI